MGVRVLRSWVSLSTFLSCLECSFTRRWMFVNVSNIAKFVAPDTQSVLEIRAQRRNGVFEFDFEILNTGSSY